MNEYVLEIKGLNKSYGKKTALTDINLELERGKIVGLLGPNGSGKTTLIKLINGLLTANSGIITVDGNPIGEKSRLSVSYLPDKTYLPDWMKVKDVMKMFEDFYENFDIKKAEDMLGKLNINGEERLKALSKGTKEIIEGRIRPYAQFFLQTGLCRIDRTEGPACHVGNFL